MNTRMQKLLIKVGGELQHTNRIWGRGGEDQWCICLLVDLLPVCPFKVINKFCGLLMSDFTALRESLQSAH